ncbi:DUF4893 domain-containing protein [Sphingomonas lutea]|uniref:DUF4893 domain-containing protein n=1 Tax=Sphingomonas lutea TaxID=1045317 RepID=A0A7G9SHQ7_9SPHN|nr:DUF4893 domain-containing protein [Sphingomonas lutea]QNN67382.1 DUF4893 domain-containing protein [Sphingomonas lutea]
MMRTAAVVATFAVAAGCRTAPKIPDGVRPSVEVAPPAKSEGWKEVATDADESRLARLSAAWAEGLSETRRNYAGEVRREGILLRPDAALPRPAPTPGSYNCRLIKLGRATPKTRAYESFKPFFCYVEVEGDLLTIVKQTGSQRPAGRLWEDDDPNRLIFLGSLALGDSQPPIAYGDDPKRDMAGVLERIGPFKWRLTIPWPQSTSKLDVFELTPVTRQPQ